MRVSSKPTALGQRPGRRALRLDGRRGARRSARYSPLRESRRLKPEIPLAGLDDIPIEDEIEACEVVHLSPRLFGASDQIDKLFGEADVVRYWDLALVIGSVALGGCSSTIFKPFDADQGSVSLDARQRTIISVERGTAAESHRVVCAEPSPDALATMAASAAASAGVSGLPQLPGSAELASSFTSAEQAALIGARNSTIQLLRDGLYRACEAYMNGALGDFGYGLVLVNYGRVMVSLLTADGLAHPPMMPPVVIGSMTGNLTTNVKGSANGPATGQNPALSATNEASGGAGATTPVSTTPPPNQTPPGPISGDQSLQIFEKVVLPLANPAEDPAGKFLEVAVACMLWLDNTGLKKAKTSSPDLQSFCGELVRKAPDLAAPALQAKIASVYGTKTPTTTGAVRTASK
jgi:hypothetical protein